MRVGCSTCFSVCTLCVAWATQAGLPEPVGTVDALELYRPAAAMVEAFSGETKAGLASCPGCLPSPEQVRAAVSQADEPLRLLARANTVPHVYWKPPKQLGSKNQMAVRADGLVALATLSLLRAETRLEAGKVANALHDLHDSAVLAVRLGQPGQRAARRRPGQCAGREGRGHQAVAEPDRVPRRGLGHDQRIGDRRQHRPAFGQPASTSTGVGTA